jgi:hypothetical protein
MAKEGSLFRPCPSKHHRAFMSPCMHLPVWWYLVVCFSKRWSSFFTFPIFPLLNTNKIRKYLRISSKVRRLSTNIQPWARLRTPATTPRATQMSTQATSMLAPAATQSTGAALPTSSPRAAGILRYCHRHSRPCCGIYSRIETQGDHYCKRDYGPEAPNQNSYHYSNADGR